MLGSSGRGLLQPGQPAGGDRLATGDADGTVSFWSLPSPILLAGAPVNSVAFSSDDSMLAVGSQDLQLWDPASRSLRSSLPTPSTTFVNAVAFAPGGRLVAAGYGNGTFQLWRTAGQAPAPLGPEITASSLGMIESVSFSPDGKILAAGSADGTVRLWDTSPAQAASAVCADEGQPLSRSAWDTSVPGVTYRVPCS